MSTETTQSKVVFPTFLNDQGTLFGGMAMQWMDEVAYIAAIRHTRKRMVTVSVRDTCFLHPVRSGAIVEVVGRVIDVKASTLDVQVELFSEEMTSGERQKAVDAVFTLAAVNDLCRPVRL